MKSYFRFLSRNKLYTAIMAAGLSVSLAFVIIMTCYIWQNLSVTRHYPDSDKIYCVGGKDTPFSEFHWGTVMAGECPEIEASVTVLSRYGNYSIGDHYVENQAFCGIDPDFFNMFPHNFVYGDKDAFNDFNNVIISKSLADRLGDEKALNMTVTDRLYGDTYRVGAVIEGFENTLFENTDIIINTRSPEFDNYRNRDEFAGWTSGTFTFIKLAEGTTPEELNEKLNKIIADRSKYERQISVSLTRLDKLYFANINEGSQGLKRGNPGLMTAFGIIVFFLLISATLNYINLSTALGGKRSKEVATRMLLGETRKEILISNLLESALFMVLCLGLAFFTAHLCLPFVNRLVNSPIPIEILFTKEYLGTILLFTGAVALLCGTVPAMLSFNFKPIEIIKGNFRHQSKKVFSKVFIIFQNAIAIIIIAVSLTMESQIKHMTDMPLNANTENLYMAHYSDVLVETLNQMPYVGRIGTANGFPGRRHMQITGPIKEDHRKDVSFYISSCDSVAFDLFGFNIVKNYGLPNNEGIWLTESAARSLEFNGDNLPRLTLFEWIFHKLDVAGIIEDVSFTSAKDLDPDCAGIVSLSPTKHHDLIIELLEPSADNIKELDKLSKEDIERVHGAENLKNYSYGYIPHLLKKEYDGMKNQLRMIEIFMLVAIMLAALGQIAMSTYFAQEKEKEIGIRKVFGSTSDKESVRSIGEYLTYCMTATIIAIPVSIWICDIYLEQFIYRMPPKPWIYVIAALAVFFISAVSVLWQTLRATRTNPADALKKE